MSVKTLIINPVGGLANRMRAIAAGIVLAKDCGAEAEIAWPVNADLGAPFEALFKPQALPVAVRNVSAAADRWVYDVPRRRNFYITKAVQSLLFKDVMNDLNGLVAWQDDDSLGRKFMAENSGRCLIRSGLEFYNYPADLYPRIFVPCDDVADAAEAVVAGADNLVGMHIRRTDHTEAIRLNTDEKFEREIERFLAADPAIKIYIATDDEALKLRLKARYGVAILSSDRPASRRSVEGMKDALKEMLILSKCRTVVGSEGSSFSVAAAKLGGHTR